MKCTVYPGGTITDRRNGFQQQGTACRKMELIPFAPNPWNFSDLSNGLGHPSFAQAVVYFFNNSSTAAMAARSRVVQSPQISTNGSPREVSASRHSRRPRSRDTASGKHRCGSGAHGMDWK